VPTTSRVIPGAAQELVLGDTADLATDVGPRH
jgi:delta 1-pyrroline-5-carboxylate dehydrogenase